jgi:hypothetical protein
MRNLNKLIYTGYKDFYCIPYIQNYGANVKGEIINLITKKLVNFLIKINQPLRFYIVINSNKKYFTAARVIADLFLNIPDKYKNINKKIIIRYKDGNYSNIAVTNLYWSTTSEEQKEKWDLIRKNIIAEFNIPDFTDETIGYYPNGIECSKFPGYYFVPRKDSFLVINKNGQVINLLTKLPANIIKNRKGYLTVIDGISQEAKTPSIHRLVGLIFIKKPDRHINLSFSELQINHKDGDKENNSEDNLEWVTNQENMEHAWNNELIQTGKRVLVKDIITNKITSFRSIGECGKYFIIATHGLVKHLRSNQAGSVIHDGHVFKYDNAEPWPDFIYEELPGTDLNSYCDTVAINVITNKRYLFNSLLHASEYLNLNIQHLKNHRARKGQNTPFMNWVFSRITDKIKEYKKKE